MKFRAILRQWGVLVMPWYIDLVLFLGLFIFVIFFVRYVCCVHTEDAYSRERVISRDVECLEYRHKKLEERVVFIEKFIETGERRVEIGEYLVIGCKSYAEVVRVKDIKDCVGRFAYSDSSGMNSFKEACAYAHGLSGVSRESFYSN